MIQSLEPRQQVELLNNESNPEVPKIRTIIIIKNDYITGTKVILAPAGLLQAAPNCINVD
jgi:hypothetical protein